MNITRVVQLTVGSADLFRRSFFYLKVSALSEFIVYLPTASDHIVMHMNRHLFYFRPGEEARMLARCQFGGTIGGGFGATLTYPIKGYPWRRNVERSYGFVLKNETQNLLFSEVKRLKKEHPNECLGNRQLWSDSFEKANGITRDRESNTLCYTIGIMRENQEPEEYYAIRENSKAFIDSKLFRIISDLIAPYEKL